MVHIHYTLLKTVINVNCYAHIDNGNCYLCKTHAQRFLKTTVMYAVLSMTKFLVVNRHTNKKIPKQNINWLENKIFEN